MADSKSFTKSLVMFSVHVNLYTASKASLIKLIWVMWAIFKFSMETIYSQELVQQALNTQKTNNIGFIILKKVTILFMFDKVYLLS